MLVTCAIVQYGSARLQQNKYSTAVRLLEVVHDAYTQTAGCRDPDVTGIRGAAATVSQRRPGCGVCRGERSIGGCDGEMERAVGALARSLPTKHN